LTVPLCEELKPPKSRVLPSVALNGMGGWESETAPGLCIAQYPEGEKLRSVTELKDARSEGLEGPLARFAESVETL